MDLHQGGHSVVPSAYAGERRRLAERRSGLSPRALSSRIGRVVFARAIGEYGRGEMMPRSGVAIALAQALGVHLG